MTHLILSLFVMAFSYRKDGPIQDTFTFNPDTLLLTIGLQTWTFPAAGSTISGSGSSVDLTSEVTGILPGANGGTGVANTGKTITLGGNLTLSGAFASTFTFTAETSLTFPITGTIATTDNVATVQTDLNTTKTGAGFGLPTADPNVTGNLWNDGGTVKVSVGV